MHATRLVNGVMLTCGFLALSADAGPPRYGYMIDAGAIDGQPSMMHANGYALVGQTSTIGDAAIIDVAMHHDALELTGCLTHAYDMGAPIPADVDASGTVDARDLLIILSNFGHCDGCSADVNRDGIVDERDASLTMRW